MHPAGLMPDRTDGRPGAMPGRRCHSWVGVTMSRDGDAWGQDHDRDGVGPIPSVAGRGERWSLQEEATVSARLHVRIIERTALVHFLDSEILFEEAVVRAVGDRLD